MNNPIRLEYPAEANRLTLSAFINSIITADPALLVTATSGNAVTVEEKYAEANAAVPTAGSVAANLAAKTAFLASLAALQTALAGNPLGEGVEGDQLSAAVQTVVAAAGIPTNGTWVTTGNSLPAGISEGDEFNYDLVTLSLADFVALFLAAAQLVRARTILVPVFTVNAK